MGSGKTTVGRLLARSLSLEFVDLDAYIESKYRKTISDLFAGKGEEEFRKIERQALHEVAQFEDVVISTGGGAPCYLDNMALMNHAGITVYLKARPEELAARLQASKTVRPLIAAKPKEELIPFITEHLAQRECYYSRAHIVYHTDRMITKKDIHLTLHGIEELLRKRKEQ